MKQQHTGLCCTAGDEPSSENAGLFDQTSVTGFRTRVWGHKTLQLVGVTCSTDGKQLHYTTTPGSSKVVRKGAAAAQLPRPTRVPELLGAATVPVSAGSGALRCAVKSVDLLDVNAKLAAAAGHAREAHQPDTDARLRLLHCTVALRGQLGVAQLVLRGHMPAT